MMQYRTRVVEDEIAERLTAVGAVVVEGPKACGKTETARRFAASEVLFDVDENARRAIEVDPRLVLEGEAPRLLDEWQLEPAIWNHVRRAVDERRKPGQFILTGSAVPQDDVSRHTGAGRLSRVRMRPMTLFETGHATGEVSLKSLLDGGASGSKDADLTVPRLAELIAVGGWPGNLDLESKRKLRAVRDYLEEIRRLDIRRVGGTSRDPNKVARLLRSLARNVATYAGFTTLASDTAAPDGELKRHTVSEYLGALETLLIVENQPPWAPNLRSKSRLRSSEKLHFVDPSLAVAALRADPNRLLEDMKMLGFLFESLVIRDLRVHAQAADASVYQYRDNTGLEIDAIVETAGGRWAAFEIKLGAGRIDEAAANLLRFADRVDPKRSGKPATLAVITGTGYGYVRDDGVCVVPVGALGP
jgi:predicted AAA+ superfamily ATPase